MRMILKFPKINSNFWVFLVIGFDFSTRHPGPYSIKNRHPISEWRFLMGIRLFKILYSIVFISRLHVTFLSRTLAEISVLRMPLRWVYFTASRILKKKVPGAQALNWLFHIIYWKFNRIQIYDFLIFGIFVVQDKNTSAHFQSIHVFTWHQK